MAWSWSHTEEAKENVKVNIRELDIETLKIVLEEIFNYQITKKQAEIKAEILKEEFNSLDLDYYQLELHNEIVNSDYFEYLVEAHENSTEEYTELSEFIYEFTEEQSLCDNSGFEAWICPFGCHTVSFSREEKNE